MKVFVFDLLPYAHAGASTVLVNLNRGAMPSQLFVEQLRRFAGKVLPALQAHTVTRARY